MGRQFKSWCAQLVWQYFTDCREQMSRVALQEWFVRFFLDIYPVRDDREDRPGQSAPQLSSYEVEVIRF
jgi:hypothetical protein